MSIRLDGMTGQVDEPVRDIESNDASPIPRIATIVVHPKLEDTRKKLFGVTHRAEHGNMGRVP